MLSFYKDCRLKFIYAGHCINASRTAALYVINIQKHKIKSTFRQNQEIISSFAGIMSLQHALKLIREIRDGNIPEARSLRTLHDLAVLSEKYDMPCSEAELSAAFRVDWQMRWARYFRK